MKIKQLRAILDSVGDEEAEVYIDRHESLGYGEFESSVRIVNHAQKKYVEPFSLRTARRPCAETASCKKSLVLYGKYEEYT